MKIPAQPLPSLSPTGRRSNRRAIPARPAGPYGEPFTIGDLRVRMVEYSPGYLADHWCERGHILYVLEGELESQLKDGGSFMLKPGMTYQVSDSGDAAHRSYTKTGAKLFIVD